MDLLIPVGIKTCVWGGLGLRRGLAPVCWQERVCWELLCSWAGFPSEICSAVPCLARNIELSFPVFLLLSWVQCLEQGRAEEPPARWLWQSAWAPTHPAGSVCPQSRARELGTWAVLGALLLLSHFTHPQGSSRPLQLAQPCSGTRESCGCCLCPGPPDPLGG